MERAYIYTRKSRALGDPDDPHLLSAHLAALTALAARDGITVPPANIRTEIGSGEKIASRPVFAALLREWEVLPPGAGGSVYVTEPSRLSRGTNAERGRILDALIRAHLTVVSPGWRFDPASPHDELTWNVTQSVDRAEVQRYKERVAIRRAEMTRNGEIVTGLAPWGYCWIKSPGSLNGREIPGHLEADPDQFPLLVRICREVLTTSVYRLSTQYGIDRTTLANLLHNPVICGYPARRYAHHQGTRPWQEKYHLLPRQEWLWPERPGDYPAACTRAEWERIQEVLALRAKRRQKTGFAENGWAKPIVSFTNAPGPVRLGSAPFTGPTYERERPGMPRLYVPRETLHVAARAALTVIYAVPGLLMRALCLLEEERSQPLPPLPDQETLRRELARERERLATLKRAGADPDLDPDDREALLTAESETKRRLARLKEELAAVRPEVPLPDLSGLAPVLQALAGDLERVWKGLGGEIKQEIVRGLIEQIPVTVTPTGAGQRYEREIGETVYQPWLARCLGE